MSNGNASRELRPASIRPDRIRGVGPIVRTISQVSFELIGDKSFENAIRESVAWLRARNRAIPDIAFQGEPFDIGGGGHHPAKAVRLEIDKSKIWAAILDFPDENTIGRTWVTEITIASSADRIHFGARLLNVSRKEDAPFSPSLPGIVRQIVGNLNAIADGIRLISDKSYVVSSAVDVEDLIALIDDHKRRLPVLVLTRNMIESSRNIIPNPDWLAKRVAGACHVFFAESDASWEITRTFGKNLSVFDGGARLYNPGFSLSNADPFEHPLWVPRETSENINRSDQIVRRILNLSARASRGDDYPRFDAVRQLAAALELDKIRGNSSDSEMNKLLEDENRRLDNDLKNIKAEFEQWIDHYQNEEDIYERNIAQLKSDLARARFQIDSLRIAIKSGNTENNRRKLHDYSEFSEWYVDNISANIWISPKAFRAMQKKIEFSNPELFGDVLIMLDELYVPMRKNPGGVLRHNYEKKLEELNCFDQPCFSDPNDIKGFPEYSVTYNDTRYWCRDHIKYGSGTDPRNFFRIYYHWHDEDQVLLIGYMPGHLDNSLTN